MKFRLVAVLGAGVLVSGAWAPVFAGGAYTIGKGHIQGPLSISNPPYSSVLNNGTITNRGHNGVPALVTSGSVNVTNNGTISATVTSASSAKAVGVSQ